MEMNIHVGTYDGNLIGFKGDLQKLKNYYHVNPSQVSKFA